MPLLVPFDGSELAEAALVRAVEFGEAFDARVIAVTVIPRDNTTYAREKGWIEDGASFDRQAVVGRLHDQVTDLCPSADFRHEVVDRNAAPGTIANRVRAVARDIGAAMVFVGSENAGRLVTSITSVGSGIAAERTYDVVIVRDRTPSRIAALREASPTPDAKSDFYLPG